MLQWSSEGITAGSITTEAKMSELDTMVSGLYCIHTSLPPLLSSCCPAVLLCFCPAPLFRSPLAILKDQIKVTLLTTAYSTCTLYNFIMPGAWSSQNVTNNIGGNCMRTEILPGIISHHSMVTLKIKDTVNKRGPGYWKLNTSLLRDADYLELIKNTIN